jgi:hypothetical protein
LRKKSVKVIAIAQVQFLAAKQILQERSRLHDIAAVLLQTCNNLPLPIDQAITFGCVPNRLLNSHRDCSCIHRLSSCTDAIFIWQTARHVSAQDSRLALSQQRYCRIGNRSWIAVTKLEDRHQAARQFSLTLPRMLALLLFSC